MSLGTNSRPESLIKKGVKHKEELKGIVIGGEKSQVRGRRSLQFISLIFLP